MADRDRELTEAQRIIGELRRRNTEVDVLHFVPFTSGLNGSLDNLIMSH